MYPQGGQAWGATLVMGDLGEAVERVSAEIAWKLTR
jgi:hypothetical protein